MPKTHEYYVVKKVDEEESYTESTSTMKVQEHKFELSQRCRIGLGSNPIAIVSLAVHLTMLNL